MSYQIPHFRNPFNKIRVNLPLIGGTLEVNGTPIAFRSIKIESDIESATRVTVEFFADEVIGDIDGIVETAEHPKEIKT